MLKKSTSTSTRTTRRTTPAHSTVLKPIFPVVPPPVTQHKKISPNMTNVTADSKVSSGTTGPFLLPTSEFFVVDKDSLVLSESDIFQTNLARKPFSVSENNVSHPSSPILSKKQQEAAAKIFQDIANTEDDFEFDNNDEKENATNMTAASIYAGLLNSQRPLPIAPLKTHLTPVNQNHVLPSTSSQSEKDKQQLDKGLRHFSAKVCAKVEEKGVTTYNEVADDLVQEIGLEMGKCDHKNIRRRVYDALNVLMAIDIIRKEKKEIRWLGLPNETADDMRELENERAVLQERISEKSRNLKEVLRRCISLKNLIDRNSELQNTHQGDKLPLPFILISAARDCHVHCEMLEDRTQYFFEFNTAFEINEDIELMRLMGLDTARIEKIKTYFPKELVAQVLMLCLSNPTATSTATMGMLTSASNSMPIAVNNSVFAPVINNEDLNLGDLESFASSSSLSSSSL